MTKYGKVLRERAYKAICVIDPDYAIFNQDTAEEMARDLIRHYRREEAPKSFFSCVRRYRQQQRMRKSGSCGRRVPAR